MKRFFAPLALMLLLCALPIFSAVCETYPDGIYRGFYYDGGIEQLAVQFELRDGLFSSIVYRGVKYKDGDYMSVDASDAQKAILRQYRQLADHLIGRGVDAIADLYSPYAIVEDLDAVTTATINSGKLISALWDGLSRHPYKIVSTSKLPAPESYEDGDYRGSYLEDGGEEIMVEFTLQNNRFTELSYRTLSYGGADYLDPDASAAQSAVASQFEALLAYLEDQPVAAISDLYQPENIAADTDVSSAATLRAPKLISALWNALSRHPYRLAH